MEPYSIVVATRNRLDDLKISLPTLLRQTVPACELIVVDSSDDQSQVAEFVESLKCSETEILYISSERGLTKQRNIGLSRVKSPIVFYPDDDSNWLRDTAEHQLKVYSSSGLGVVSAVCGTEINKLEYCSCGQFSESTIKDPRPKRTRSFSSKVRSYIEAQVVPDPVTLLGRRNCEEWNRAIIGGIPDGVRPVPYMTGFRMSFRTSILRKFGFDELLVGYAPFEDVDASISAWKYGAVLASTRSKIFHNKNTSSRGNAYVIGGTHLLNRAYVCSKHSSRHEDVRQHVVRHARLKMFGYLISARSRYGYLKYLGARSVIADVRKLGQLEGAALSSHYRNARERLLQASGA